MAYQQCRHVSGYPPSQCLRAVKKEIDGKGYCGLHARWILHRQAEKNNWRWREERVDEEWMQRSLLKSWLLRRASAPVRVAAQLTRLTLKELLAVRELIESSR